MSKNNSSIYLSLLSLLIVVPLYGMEINKKFKIYEDNLATYTYDSQKRLSDEQLGLLIPQISSNELAAQHGITLEERETQLKNLLDVGINPNARNILGVSWLQAVIGGGDISLVEPLLKHPKIEVYLPDHIEYAQRCASNEKNENKKIEREKIYELVKNSKWTR